MRIPFQLALFLRFFLLLIFIGLFMGLTWKELYYSAFFIGFLGLALFTETYFFMRNRANTYDKTLLSILQNDFSAALPEAMKTGNYANLYRVYEVLKYQAIEQESVQHVYHSILDNIDTGLLILKKDGSDWQVFLMNAHFSKLFGVPKMKLWSQLRTKLSSFAQAIEEIGFEEIKTTADIQIDQGQLQTFLLQATLNRGQNDTYYVIFLDSIQKVVEKRDKEVWRNLMNVISHELMNSLTPIQSLSQSLSEITLQNQTTADDWQDLREGLATIWHRSNHLRFFVDNYRKLALLPNPVKSPVIVRELIENCMAIMERELQRQGVTIINSVPAQKMLLLDARQMEQVFINLFTNSLFALEKKSHKEISVSSLEEENRFFIMVSDSGSGIDKEIRSKIFMPFFTTRKDGAGIGLALSKNIVEAHCGYLSYVPKEDRTEFVLSLLSE